MFVHTMRARECSSHENKRTESELDIARLESRARAVDSEFASEGGEAKEQPARAAMDRKGFNRAVEVQLGRK